MTADSRKNTLEVSCQQILMQDSSVYSVQWLDLPAQYADTVTAELLLRRYLDFVREWTRGLIRPLCDDRRVEFRVLWTSIALLSFTAPQHHVVEGDRSVSLSICGGLLVQSGECGRGMFSLHQVSSPSTVRVMVQLSDYCPLILGSAAPSRLRRLLYRLTQAYIHKVVTVKFLSRLYRDLTGATCRPVVKKVKVREGAET